MSRQTKFIVTTDHESEKFTDVEQAALWCACHASERYTFTRLDDTPLLTIVGHETVHSDDDWWTALDDYERDFIVHLLAHLRDNR